MKYVFEKGISMPLCAIQDGNYFNYLTGQVLDNKNVINFIKRGLESKSMKIQDFKLNIYKIVDIEIKKAVGYNYEINGVANYLQINRNPYNRRISQFIREKLFSGEYIQELIWG